ncbi:MAG: dTDP-4-dehydrorhamnose reductase [Chloroflexota bacterium]|nr:dTDP-4-dehydrorhamnose reductase [Chloroflexota bacterium]
MLGRDLLALLRREGEEASGLARHDVDVTDAAAVRSVIRQRQPGVVVNCAAWTAVDEAETHEKEALAVNGSGAGNLAAACSASDAKLIQLSTNYVFSGTASQPYPEDAPARPRTAYGRTKLAGEEAVLRRLPDAGYIIRTAWLYGAQGPNFVRMMIRLERTRPWINVVDDQHGQPTWTMDVAARIVDLAWSGAAAGIYHVTSSGETTWCGLAREIFRLLGADPCRIEGVPSTAMNRPASRPAYGVLSHAAWAAASLQPIPNWRFGLRRAFPPLLAAEA